MKRLGLLAFVVIFGLTLAFSSLAQGPGSQMYNPQTVETISGLVVSVAPVAPKGGLPERVHLTLKTDKETIPVFLGPSSFIDQAGMKITALDQLQVTGSRIMLQEKPAIIAAEVKKGDQVLKLRDEEGTPLWGGRRGPSQSRPYQRGMQSQPQRP